ARFHVPIEEGRRLLAQLRGRITGLAWPTYVLDIPGGYGKVPIGPDYLEPPDWVRDPTGTVRLREPAQLAQPPAPGLEAATPKANPKDHAKKRQANPDRGRTAHRTGRSRWARAKAEDHPAGKGGRVHPGGEARPEVGKKD